MSVYTIDTTLRSDGTEHHSDYYPDGYPYSYDGYVTSYSQYVDELRRYLTSSEVRLYTIDADGSSTYINSESDLRRAVKNLPNGGDLAVTAIKYTDDDEDGQPDPLGPYHESVSDIMYRFDVPSDFHYDCGESSYTVRYFWRWDSKYCISREYYYNNLSSSERENWKRGNDGGAPWQGDAPEASLSEEYGSPVRDEVCHLQYILTRLGFMSLYHTDGLVGSYRRYTARAVRRFRERYNIYGGDMEVYNSRTADKMASVVRSFRRGGAQFI